MLIFILFIYVPATSHCFDLGLEDGLYLGNGVLNPMQNILKSEQNSPNEDLRNDVNVPNQDYDVKDDLDSKFNDHLEIFAKKPQYNPVTEDPGPIKKVLFENKNIKSFKSDLLAIKSKLFKGILKINNIDTLGINNSTIIQTLLDNATNAFRENFDSYFKEIHDMQSVTTDLDRESVILDLIETTNHLLLKTGKEIVRSIHEASLTSYNQFTKIEDIVLNEKKAAFKYACEELQVCRHFHGFIDKMADLINEILILDDIPYNRVINDIIQAIDGKNWFFRKITTADTRKVLQTNLAPRKKDPEYIRELLIIVQREINQRYKLLKNDKPEMKVKTTAVRILLDLIDKAFHSEDDDYFNLELETIIRSIKRWAEGNTRSKISPFKLINRIVEMLNYYWGGGTKEDVKVLIELIVFGTTRNAFVYEELFAKGAYNRRDDENEIHSDSE